MTDQLEFLALRAGKDRIGISAVGTGLFASDEQFGSSVNLGSRRFRGTGLGFDGCEGLFGRVTRSGIVGLQTLPSALPSETAFSSPAKTGGGIELVGRIDPRYFSANDLGARSRARLMFSVQIEAANP